MGAESFSHQARGANATEAFNAARAEAAYNHGHAGYTGTVTEKIDFVMIPLPEGRTAHEYANELINTGDDRIDDKWGPAGCIQVSEDLFLFFGWASS